LDTGPPIENREIPLCLETSLLYVKKSDTVTHPTESSSHMVAQDHRATEKQLIQKEQSRTYTRDFQNYFRYSPTFIKHRKSNIRCALDQSQIP
jgi:hypothetical protein